MKQITLGVDPDVNGNGLSVYVDKVLTELLQASAFDIGVKIMEYQSKGYEVKLHMENVMKNKKVWHNKGQQTAETWGMTCQKVGMNKQCQREVQMMCEVLRVPVFLHDISSLWKDKAGTIQFKVITGWKASGNQDTRSAAYFGWLGTTGNFSNSH